MRRAGVGVAASMLSTYALLSLPFLDLHVALAGTADLYVGVAYGMAAIALWRWSLTREMSDLVLALAMAMICIAVKIEGALWVLTLLPGAIVAIDRRVGFALTAMIAVAAAAYLAFGPQQIILFDYLLRTRFEDVSLPLAQHLFVMDNWHLLWYAAIAVIALRWRLLLQDEFAPMTLTMLGGCAFVFVVFFYSSASGGVDDESLVNRLLLHLVPALAYYLSLLIVNPAITRERAVFERSTEDGPVVAGGGLLRGRQ
jgi:glucose-6-phosphate-specific signal transduction histidine kinase